MILTVNAQQLSAYGRAVRRACRINREAHLSVLADRISSGPADEVFAAYHSVLGQRRRKAYKPEPLPIVNRSDGTPCTTAAEIQERWWQHFGDLEAGQQTSLEAIAD